MLLVYGVALGDGDGVADALPEVLGPGVRMSVPICWTGCKTQWNL
jgi:hypothetical protein